MKQTFLDVISSLLLRIQLADVELVPVHAIYLLFLETPLGIYAALPGVYIVATNISIMFCDSGMRKIMSMPQFDVVILVNGAADFDVIDAWHWWRGDITVPEQEV